ncbi:MAG: hypothetical protein HY519_03190, partial [Candidatus Aenigmarchaeota archaeon]|nr:hypothetical protein [Candidatus Aenigmarchaeota archaeon]
MGKRVFLCAVLGLALLSVSGISEAAGNCNLAANPASLSISGLANITVSYTELNPSGDAVSISCGNGKTATARNCRGANGTCSVVCKYTQALANATYTARTTIQGVQCSPTNVTVAGAASGSCVISAVPDTLFASGRPIINVSYNGIDAAGSGTVLVSCGNGYTAYGYGCQGASGSCSVDCYNYQQASMIVAYNVTGTVRGQACTPDRITIAAGLNASISCIRNGLEYPGTDSSKTMQCTAIASQFARSYRWSLANGSDAVAVRGLTNRQTITLDAKQPGTARLKLEVFDGWESGSRFEAFADIAVASAPLDFVCDSFILILNANGSAAKTECHTDNIRQSYRWEVAGGQATVESASDPRRITAATTVPGAINLSLTGYSQADFAGNQDRTAKQIMAYRPEQVEGPSACAALYATGQNRHLVTIFDRDGDRNLSSTDLYYSKHYYYSNLLSQAETADLANWSAFKCSYPRLDCPAIIAGNEGTLNAYDENNDGVIKSNEQSAAASSWQVGRRSSGSFSDEQFAAIHLAYLYGCTFVVIPTGPAIVISSAVVKANGTGELALATAGMPSPGIKSLDLYSWPLVFDPDVIRIDSVAAEAPYKVSYIQNLAYANRAGYLYFRLEADRDFKQNDKMATIKFTALGAKGQSASLAGHYGKARVSNTVGSIIESEVVPGIIRIGTVPATSISPDGTTTAAPAEVAFQLACTECNTTHYQVIRAGQPCSLNKQDYTAGRSGSVSCLDGACKKQVCYFSVNADGSETVRKSRAFEISRPIGLALEAPAGIDAGQNGVVTLALARLPEVPLNLLDTVQVTYDRTIISVLGVTSQDYAVEALDLGNATGLLKFKLRLLAGSIPSGTKLAGIMVQALGRQGESTTLLLPEPGTMLAVTNTDGSAVSYEKTDAALTVNQPFCSLTAVPAAISGNGTAQINVTYRNLNSTPSLITVNCGNGFSGGAAGCSGTSGSCSMPCVYSAEGTFIVTAAIAGQAVSCGQAQVLVSASPRCALSVTPPTLNLSAQSRTAAKVTLSYSGLAAAPGKADIDCGNGNFVQAENCHFNSGSCQAACTYSEASDYELTATVNGMACATATASVWELPQGTPGCLMYAQPTSVFPLQRAVLTVAASALPASLLVDCGNGN